MKKLESYYNKKRMVPKTLITIRVFAILFFILFNVFFYLATQGKINTQTKLYYFITIGFIYLVVKKELKQWN